MKLLNAVDTSLGIIRNYGRSNNPIVRYRTFCCALGQLSLDNSHTEEEIKEMVELVKKETETKWTPDNRSGGERALFVITTMPHEKPLANKLEKIGFRCVTEINRRNGYTPGTNLIWIISW